MKGPEAPSGERRETVQKRLRLPKELWDQVERAAKADSRTRTNWVEHAIIAALANPEFLASGYRIPDDPGILRPITVGAPHRCGACGHLHHVGPPDNRCTVDSCDCPAPSFDPASVVDSMTAEVTDIRERLAKWWDDNTTAAGLTADEPVEYTAAEYIAQFGDPSRGDPPQAPGGWQPWENVDDPEEPFSPVHRPATHAELNPPPASHEDLNPPSEP